MFLYFFNAIFDAEKIGDFIIPKDDVCMFFFFFFSKWLCKNRQLLLGCPWKLVTIVSKLV